MDIPFLKNILKDYPKFWEEYLLHFENKQSVRRFVVFDLKRSSENTANSLIVLSGIGIENDTIRIDDFLELFIKKNSTTPEEIIIHDILKDDNEKVNYDEAIIQFIKFIREATLVSQNIENDIELINEALENLNAGKLKNEFMDINIMYQKLKDLPQDEIITLDQLCDAYKIKKNDRYTSSGDTYIKAQIFLKLKRKLNINF